jgi:hypothetical protein
VNTAACRKDLLNVSNVLLENTHLYKELRLRVHATHALQGNIPIILVRLYVNHVQQQHMLQSQEATGVCHAVMAIILLIQRGLLHVSPAAQTLP